ncbi:MAG: isoaspartyl peptidase/L-asparaginase family protein [candidate division WOR-3 bacterium]|nr:isoaspartyl peptidase/L-asparaginase family protein [candidate division WOR-3 bacterium]MDW7987741.1 isoaspartyl peptidase/L-asparaginase family protein [candidate division WOR-3 bacterium]
MPVIVVHGGAGKLKNIKEHQIGIRKALEIGWAVLKENGNALNAVLESVQYMENSGIFNCGRGAVLTLDGKVELDASVMTDDGKFGAVGAVRGVKNPVLLAYKVMEETDHLLLVGPGARDFAYKFGFKRYYKINPHQKKRWEQLIKNGVSQYFPKLKMHLKFGTVGAVALDSASRIAVANSTGGIIGKLSGRIGDTPIIGAGIYANFYGGVCATGHGEGIMRLFLSKYVADLMVKFTAQTAIKRGINLAKKNNVLCGIIGIDRKGNIGIGYNTESMSWGYIKNGNLKIFQ